MGKYFVVLSSSNYDSMGVDGDEWASPLDLVSHLTNRDASELDQDNYLDYLRFDPRKRREVLAQAFGLENGAALYIGNQVGRLAPEAKVVHVDGNRAAIGEVIERQGARPEAVFVTSISSSFPAAVSSAIVLNHARIPVILGGIHVSTTPEDVDSYIRDVCPHPELVSQVRGPGDSQVIGEVLRDLEQGTLKRDYAGRMTIEDGVWRTPPNVARLPLMALDTRGIPVFGRFLEGKIRIILVSPYLGCPYSCSFCSVSTLPLDQRRLVRRSAADVLDELTAYQESEEGAVPYPVYLFATDNLLLGGDVLDEILDGIIERKLKVPFMAQISIEVASNERLLERMRMAGAMTFLYGFESLDMRNLEHINKHCVHDIKESGLSVPEYYARQIEKTHDYGIGILGSFIFGLPYDRYDSPESHTGTEVAQFCVDNRIGLQPHVFGALPGARAFQECLDAGTLLYGAPGTMSYLRALCLADHTAENTRRPEGLANSPMSTAAMAVEAMHLVGTGGNGFRNAAYMGRRAFACPTARGRASYRARLDDCLRVMVTEFGWLLVAGGSVPLW